MPRNPQNLFLGGPESNKGFREGLRRVDKLRETSRSRWEGPGAGALEARPGPPTWLRLSSPRLGSRLAQPGESPRRPKFAADSAGCQRQADRSWRLGPGQGWTPPPGPPKQPIPGGRGEGPGRSLPTPPGPDHHPRRSAARPRGRRTPCRHPLPRVTWRRPRPAASHAQAGKGLTDTISKAPKMADVSSRPGVTPALPPAAPQPISGKTPPPSRK